MKGGNTQYSCAHTAIGKKNKQQKKSGWQATAEKSEFALIDNKWSAWSGISSYESCFACKTFCNQKKGGRPKQCRQKDKKVTDDNSP